MKKYFPVFMLVCLVCFNLVPVASAAQATWQLTCQDDSTILERVVVEGKDITSSSQWQRSQEGAKLILERKVENWQAYSKLEDRFPLSAQVRDFIVYKVTTLNLDETAVNTGGVFSQVADLDQLRLEIAVPGIIRENSATMVDELTAFWDPFSLEYIDDTQRLLKAVIFDGLLLAVTIFGLGLLIIAGVFINRIRNVHKLIDDEYSLERAAEELQTSEKSESIEK